MNNSNKSYKIITLPGDGIGPEIMICAIKVLELVAKKYDFNFELSEHLFGGCSIDKYGCLLYTSPSPRDRQKSRMPSSA